jgi:hypothetical protein
VVVHRLPSVVHPLPVVQVGIVVRRRIVMADPRVPQRCTVVRAVPVRREASVLVGRVDVRSLKLVDIRMAKVIDPAGADQRAVLQRVTVLNAGRWNVAVLTVPRRMVTRSRRLLLLTERY